LRTWADRSLLRCPSCGLIHISTVDARPHDQLETLDPYAEAIAPYRAAFADEHARVLRMLERSMPVAAFGARLLEVGSALGWFLDAASARGFVCEGIEPAAASPGLRSRHADSITRVGTVESLSLSGDYHAVVMLQVIEHLEDPRACLTRLVDALAPGGVLLAETPSYRGLSRRLRLPGWEAPNYGIGHTVLFDPNTLSRLFRDVGLEVVVVTTYHKGLALGARRRMLPLLNAVLAPLRLGNNVCLIGRKPA
jgi:SAM-dependent methyltransferase